MTMGLLILLAAGAGLIVIVGTAALVYGLLHPQRRTYAWVVARGLPTEPADMGLVAQDITFNFRDGSASPGWIVQGGEPDGPVIVMTHGWGSSRYHQLGMVELLCQAASQVVVYDARGHGDCTGPISRLGTTEVDDLLLVLQQMPDLSRRIVLWGASMGASTTLVAAARGENDRVIGVIVDGPYRHAMEPIIGRLKSLRLPPYPFVWLACAYIGLRLGGFSRFDRAAHAAQLPCPLLVLHGTADVICKLNSARQIAQAAPHGELVEFDGALHGKLATHDRGRYLQSVQHFIARVCKQQVEMGARDANSST